MKRVVIVGSILAVVLLLVAGVAATVVLAQGPTPTPNGKNNRANLFQLYLQSLASKLGISVSTLQSDITAAEKDALTQAVNQGLISQAQANKLQQRLNANPNQGLAPRFVPGPRPQMRPGFRAGAGFGARLGFVGPSVLEAVANTLKMNPADVTSALRSGKTLTDLAKQQNVNPSDLQTAIVNAYKSDLDRAVKDGLMTQAQADAIMAHLSPSKINLNRPFFGWGGRNRDRKRPTPKATPVL